jgi:Spy/CpxP family protein refolding chaperone
MTFSKSLWLCGAALVISSAVMAADSKTATDSTPATPKGHARLTKPWNELKDLTDDEKAKILEIHQKAVDDVKEIDAKEHKDIMALLTEDQQKEVAEIEKKDKAARSKKPTTQPAAAASAK